MTPKTQGYTPSPLYVLGDERDTGCIRLDRITHIEIGKQAQASLYEGNGYVWCMEIGLTGKDSDSDLVYEFRSEAELRRESEKLVERWKEWIEFEYSVKQ